MDFMNRSALQEIRTNLQSTTSTGVPVSPYSHILLTRCLYFRQYDGERKHLIVVFLAFI